MASAGPSRSRSAREVISTESCTHYERKCNMMAACCNKVVCCHIGHDERKVCRQKMDKTLTRTIICCECKTSQPVGPSCTNCNKSFARKWCAKCCLWYGGNGFHCPSCDICRRGDKNLTMHCHVCRMCFSLQDFGKHVCTEDALGRRCPSCDEHMFNSRSPCVLMRCGHYIHSECFMERVKSKYTCPRRDCHKTVADMSVWFHALDTVVNAELEEMESKGRRPSTIAIYCYDCRAKSMAKDHEFKKCGNKGCGSYNTTRIPPSQHNLPFVLPKLPQHRRHLPSMD